MGGSSRSSNQTTNLVDNSTRQDFTNQQGAGLAVDGSSNSITVTDGGAVKDALSFAGESVGEVFNFADESSAQAFEFGGDSVDGAYNLSRAVVDSQREMNRENLSQSVKLAQGAISDAAQNNARAFQFAQAAKNPGAITSDQFKYMAVAATALGVALILKGRK